MGETHRVKFEPVDLEMEVEESETVLDAAFRQGITLMHGCREGQCSACKSFLIDGDVQMDRYSTFALADYESEEGYILLCKTHVYSDAEIELINYDEEVLRDAVPLQKLRVRVRHLRAADARHRLAGSDPDHAGEIRVQARAVRRHLDPGHRPAPLVLDGAPPRPRPVRSNSSSRSTRAATSRGC